MKLKFWIIFPYFITIGFISNAQAIKFSDKPEEFITNTKAIMATTGNEQAIAVANGLETLWTTKITDNQKTKIIVISKAMAAKNYKASPQFLLFFDCLKIAYNFKNANESQIDSFLSTTEKMLANAEGKQIANFWEKSRMFFFNKTLYTSNYNKLYVFGAGYSFNYLDREQEAKAAELNTKIAEKILDDSWDDTIPLKKAETEVPIVVVPPTFAQGARIEFKNIDIVIATSADSVTIKGSNATYGFREDLLAGEGGTFSWEVAGLKEVTTTLGNYSMPVKSPKIVSPNATLNYQNKIKTPILGAFQYESKKRQKGSPSTYPRFVSQKNDIEVKELGNNIDYKGGFSLIGKRIFSTSLHSKSATITYNKNGKPLFRSSSNRFEIGDSLITAPYASFVAYLAGDSIFNQAIKFSFDRKSLFLRTNRIDKGGFRGSTYLDNYHEMEISADAMRWYIDKDKMDFYILSGKKVVPALFESFDNYDLNIFPSLTGQYGFHPLQLINSYLKKNGVNYVYLADLAVYANKSFEIIKEAIVDMQEKGMANIDLDEGVKLSRKGAHYIAAYSGKKDFDNFIVPSFFTSSSKDTTANATINMKDNVLTVKGVRRFNLSDSLNTLIIPKDGQVQLKKARNFTFNGKLISKNYRFTGNNFDFDYDQFSVKMNKIDSITFVPQKAMAKGGRSEVGGNLRYDSAGMIYINRPDNHSGKIKAEEYPKLEIGAGITVYFDQEERANGAYTKNVYFKIPTIKNDSLNKKDLNFAGTFYGGDMIGNFNESLISMPDGSLGFVHKSLPNEKLTLYKTKSNITFNELKMDNSGLHADAEFNHLKTNFKTNKLTIYPDSLIAFGKTGSVEEGSIGQIYYPKVGIKDFSLLWLPKVDSLIVKNAAKYPFELYGESTKLDGKLVARNAGLFAEGTVKRSDTEIKSNQIKFDQNTIIAKNALVKVGPNVAVAKPVMMSYNANVAYNTKNNLVKFDLPISKELDDTTALYLPYSAYKTSIASAEWDILKKTITMKGKVANSTFTSLVTEQGGLAFNGNGAVYDIEKMALNITGVPYIDIVDSRLKPANGQVFIKKDGDIQKLIGASLLIDSISSYHTLVEANIKILTKNEFQGDAKYRYTNALGDTTLLKITSFEILENKTAGLGKAKGFYTIAKANITEKDKFFVSPKMQYRGEINAIAGDQTLSLDGAVRPFIKKRKDLDNWLTFKGKINDGIKINIDEQLKSESGSLFAGWHYRSNGGGLYTTFLSLKEASDDQDIFIGTGALTEDAKEKRFEVSSVINETQKYYYEDQTNVINLEGKYNLFTKNDFIQTAGFARIVPDSNKYSLNTMMVFGFPLPSEIQAAMGNKIVKSNLDEAVSAEPAEADKDRLVAKVAQLIGLKAAGPYQTKIQNLHVPLHTAAPIFNASLVLADVDLKWNDKTASYHSIGKVGVSNIGTVDINAQMTCYVEIRKSPDGIDELSIYLEASDKLWYFMNYKQNQLAIVSSDEELNNAINAKSKVKVKTGEYSFGLIDELEKQVFTDNFRANYKVSKKPVIAKKVEPKKAVKKEEEKEGF